MLEKDEQYSLNVFSLLQFKNCLVYTRFCILSDNKGNPVLIAVADDLVQLAADALPRLTPIHKKVETYCTCICTCNSETYMHFVRCTVKTSLLKIKFIMKVWLVSHRENHAYDRKMCSNITTY